MLDNEPDTDQTPTTSAEPAAPAPRRRRAASRPAGPPTSPPPAPAASIPAVEDLDASPAGPPPAADTQAEVPAREAQQVEMPAAVAESQPEIPVAELAAQPEPVEQVPAKRPARRSTAKKAADPAPQEAADPAVDDAPPKRSPRKRATKKVPDTEGDESSAAQAAAASPAETSTVATPAAAPAPAGWVEPTEAPDVSADDAPPLIDAPEDAAVTPSGQGSPDPAGSVHTESVDTGNEPAVGAAVEHVGDEAAVEENVAEEDQADENVAGDNAADANAADENESATATEPDYSWLADPFAVPAAHQQSPTPAVAEPETGGPSPAEDDADAVATEDDEGGDSSPRRRRRRGGRRRRRSGGDEDASDSDEDSQPEEDGGSAPSAELTAAGSPGEPAETPSEDADDSDGEDSEGQRRRRRRRRRRGEETATLPDDPTEVVVRVREPRARKRAAASSSEVTGIEGSTRMEAKRQRRREGRDAGRRRVPILSEAEFLARRESVLRQMVIRQSDELAQIAVLEDGILVEHYVDRDSAASLIGNVYLGRVQNVLPSMEAAFIDIGRGRNAVLYAGEVDWDSFGADGHNRKVEKVLKSGQMILVQVSKDPVGAKGARLTNHVSIPGRYIVYAPGGHLSGISRKLPDVERKRLKDILADLVGESASVIVRTAAEGASEEELVRDVNRLKAQWADIEKKVKAGNSPQLLYGEPDLTVRIVRDLFTEDFSELIIQGNGSMNDAYDAITGYVTHVAPHLQERIRRWEPTGESDLFAEYRLDEQIAKALERKVFLPSGGSLVIDRTEAMTVIDVNTGKFTGTGGNLEATVTSNNLEAAEEIVRQLRLRDIGGIIVIDFIDMVLPSNRELLLRRLVECLGRDRTRHQVAEVTSLGLIQMTRKKIGTGLLEAFGTECPHCHGRGYELHDMPVDSQQQADGGTRDQRGRDNRGRGSDGPKPGGASRNGSARTGANDVAPAEASDDAADPDSAEPVARGRGGRRGRGNAGHSDGATPEAPAAPQPEGVTSA